MIISASLNQNYLLPSPQKKNVKCTLTKINKACLYIQVKLFNKQNSWKKSLIYWSIINGTIVHVNNDNTSF